MREVKQSAFLPEPIFKQPTFTTQAIIKWRAGKRSLQGDLNLIQARLPDKFENPIKVVGCLSVQSEDEAAVNRDPRRLNPFDCFQILADQSCICGSIGDS